MRLPNLTERRQARGEREMTPLYWIDGPWPGRLAIASRPRGGDWLADELADWRAAGVDEVISTLTDPETRELDLTGERDECNRLGILFDSLPIDDRAVPDVSAAVEKFHRWQGELASGRSLAVHCRQGIGRSSLVAASLLTLAGRSAGDSWLLVERARGRAVPDTPEQKRWIDRLRAADSRAANQPAS